MESNCLKRNVDSTSPAGDGKYYKKSVSVVRNYHDTKKKKFFYLIFFFIKGGGEPFFLIGRVFYFERLVLTTACHMMRIGEV